MSAPPVAISAPPVARSSAASSNAWASVRSPCKNASQPRAATPQTAPGSNTSTSWQCRRAASRSPALRARRSSLRRAGSSGKRRVRTAVASEPRPAATSASA
eukprot:1196067-Prorocentrum_minimum.AAC.18